MYSALVFLVVAVLSVSAQDPKRCSSPPELKGKILEFDSKRSFGLFGNFTYDRENERVAIHEDVVKMSERDYYYVYRFFQKRVEYIFNVKTRQCEKRDMKEDEKFFPLEIPATANFEREIVIGSNFDKRYGLTVNEWSDDFDRGHFFGIWTDVGCFPVHNAITLQQTGDVIRQDFYDLALGYDPERFIPPRECTQ